MKFAPCTILLAVKFHVVPKVNHPVDVSWMDAAILSNNKVSKHNLGLFKHAQSMSKQPAGSAYIGSFVSYLLYLPDPLPRGLGIDLEGSSTFLPFILSMHLYRLGLF